MAEKKDTGTISLADFEQGVLTVGMSLIEDYRKGVVVNKEKFDIIDAIIKVYNAVKVREPPDRINAGKSK